MSSSRSIHRYFVGCASSNATCRNPHVGTLREIRNREFRFGGLVCRRFVRCALITTRGRRGKSPRSCAKAPGIVAVL